MINFTIKPFTLLIVVMESNSDLRIFIYEYLILCESTRYLHCFINSYAFETNGTYITTPSFIRNSTEILQKK